MLLTYLLSDRHKRAAWHGRTKIWGGGANVYDNQNIAYSQKWMCMWDITVWLPKKKKNLGAPPLTTALTCNAYFVAWTIIPACTVLFVHEHVSDIGVHVGVCILCYTVCTLVYVCVCVYVCVLYTINLHVCMFCAYVGCSGVDVTFACLSKNSYVPRLPKPGETIHGTQFIKWFGGPRSMSFLSDLGRRTANTTGDKSSLAYLLQRFSVAIQRENAASILWQLVSVNSWQYSTVSEQGKVKLTTRFLAYKTLAAPVIQSANCWTLLARNGRVVNYFSLTIIESDSSVYFGTPPCNRSPAENWTEWWPLFSPIQQW